MRLLLDTHALLWFLTDSPKLSPAALTAIETPGNSVCVSIASLWEIAIKASIGKLSLPAPFKEVFPAQLEVNNIGCMPITYECLYRLNDLKFHHRDPSDRLLIAQASTDGLTLVSRDAQFRAYGIPLLW